MISQQVGNTIYIATNTTSFNKPTTLSKNTTTWPTSDILIQDGSSFSVVKFPIPSTQPDTYAVYRESKSYTSPGLQELSDWSILPQNTKSAAKFISNNDGVFLVNANIRLTEFIGVATFYFMSSKGALATTQLTCQQKCEEYITLNNFVRLLTGDTVSVFLRLGANSKLSIAATSRRSIFYIRPFTKSVGISVRVNDTMLIPKSAGSRTTITGYSIPDGSHGTFDARGNYLTRESMIIPKTGSYQVVVNLILMFNDTSKRFVVKTII